VRLSQVTWCEYRRELREEVCSCLNHQDVAVGRAPVCVCSRTIQLSSTELRSGTRIYTTRSPVTVQSPCRLDKEVPHDCRTIYDEWASSISTTCPTYGSAHSPHRSTIIVNIGHRNALTPSPTVAISVGLQL